MMRQVISVLLISFMVQSAFACETCQTSAPTAAATTSPQTACGLITLKQFNAAFNQSASSIDINLNFIAMSQACSMAQVTMDVNQASFWLGSVMANTPNLTLPMTNPTDLGNMAKNNSKLIKPFAPKGVLMMAGALNYSAFASWTLSLGLGLNLTGSTQLVANNLIVSYLSGLFLMTQIKDSTGANCMCLTADKKMGQCIALLDATECQNDARLMFHLYSIQTASGLLTNMYTNAEIMSFNCPKLDCSTTPEPSPKPTEPECSDSKVSAAPATPKGTPSLSPKPNRTMSVAPATPAPTQSCNETSTPAPTTASPCLKCIQAETLVSAASANNIFAILPLLTLALAATV